MLRQNAELPLSGIKGCKRWRCLWRATVSLALPHHILCFVLHRRPFAFFSAKSRMGCLETLTLLPPLGHANCTAWRGFEALGCCRAQKLYWASSKDIFSSHLMVSRQGRTPFFPTLKPTVRCEQGWYSRKLILIILFVIILWGGKNATSAFPHRRIWQLMGTWHWLPWQGPDQPHQSSSWLSFRNMSSPLGVRESNNPLCSGNPGQSLVAFWLFFLLLGLLSSPLSSNQNQLCACLPLIYLSRVLFSVTAETHNEIRAIHSLLVPKHILIWEALPL